MDWSSEISFFVISQVNMERKEEQRRSLSVLFRKKLRREEVMANGEGFFVRNGSLGELSSDVCQIHGKPLKEKEVKHRPPWEIDVPLVRVCSDCQKEKPRKQGRNQRNK